MKKKFFVILLALSAFLISANAQMRVHLINVGQGCATLIEFPCAAILVDAGGETNAQFNSSDSLKKYLDDFFDRRTDLNHTLQCVYLTHPHKDHTLGVPVLLQPPFVIKNVVTDGLEQGSGKDGQIKLHRLAQASEANSDPTDDIGLEAVTTSKIGASGLTNAVIDPVNCSGTNPVITVLWGASATNPGWSKANFGNENNHSLVIRIDYGAASLLITGDLEDIAQQGLLAKYAGTNLLDADIYIVGHHGSKNGSSQDLINKITPKVALIGAGDPARHLSWTAWDYGHPNKGTLDRLQSEITSTRTTIHIQAGTSKRKFVNYDVSKAIYATGWDGNVVIEAEANGQWHKVESFLVPALVNINTATVDQLMTLPGIGATKAQAIISYRSSHGNFTSIDQLDNVPGIGPSTINLLRAYATL